MIASRRSLLAGAGGLALSGAARAQTAPCGQLPDMPTPTPGYQIGGLSGRTRTALDGLWKYVADPFDIARRKPRDRRTVWKNLEEDVLKGPLVEYEWASHADFRVPGDWNSRVTELAFYDGTVYFARFFEAAPKPGRRQFLSFEAVNDRCVVWLNGEEIGAHEGGFTGFAFEVTGKLKAGANFLTVRADARHTDETLPASDFDWQNYGGITRSVWLVETADTFIRDWFIRLEGGAIRADVTLDGQGAAGAPVRVSFPDLRLTLSGTADSAGRAALSAPAPRRLALWSPQAPVRHACEISAGGEIELDQIGFRRIETRGREILLNGAPVYLKGIALHEEALGAVASRSVSRAQARAPPIRREPSRTVTSTPASCSVSAAPSPESPAPTITTLCRSAARAPRAPLRAPATAAPPKARIERREMSAPVMLLAPDCRGQDWRAPTAIRRASTCS